MTSSSIHKLSADLGLTRNRLRLWMALNWSNNHFLPNSCAPHLAQRDFEADTSEQAWSRTGTLSSPPRKLSDLFWLQLPWDAIHTELGKLAVFDSGCGSGSYGPLLETYSGRPLDRYVGVDIEERQQWTQLTEQHRNYRFHCANSSDLLPYIPDDATLIMSQSAIEHFENDLKYFADIAGFVQVASRPVIQIHLFPSSACLELYLGHGVRQYTPRTVSRITRLFEPFSYSTLFRLGGKSCNELHLEFITIPLLRQRIGDMRNSRSAEYDSRLRTAVEADRGRAELEPSFYALVIHSNWNEKIFK